MILKPTTKYFASFIMTAALLIAFDSLAFAQSARGTGQLPETAERAEAFFQNALRLAEKQDSKASQLQLQQAMGLWARMDEPGQAAAAALQIGHRFKNAREYGNALDDYRLALNVASLPGPAKANALNAIAQLYSELYLNDLAMRYFTQALAQARISNALAAQMLSLTGLADLYRQQGAMPRALSLITEAERLGVKGQIDADPALLYLKGQIRQTQGFVDDARGAFAKALAIYGRANNVAGQVKVLCALSSLSMLVSQKQPGFEQAKQAVSLAEEQATRAANHVDFMNARDLRWRAWLAQARAERALGQRESAHNSYKRAINHFEGAWWEFYNATETSAVAFREEAQAAYREDIDLLVELGQCEQAYQLADQSKARTILTFSGARRARPLSGYAEQVGTLRELSRSIASLRLKLRDSGLSRKREATILGELEDAEYKIKETRLQAEMAWSRERLVWADLATPEKMQDQTVRAQMTLAEFSLGENRSFVWLFNKGKVLCQTLPPRREIENAVRPFLEMLAAAPNEFDIEGDLAKLRGKSEALFKTLFGSLSNQIEPGQRLIIVADGLLHYLPFEALTHDGHYLIEDHEVSYLLSASMLLQHQGSRGEAETGDRMELLAVGDPIFGPELKGSVTKKSGSARIDVIRSARLSRGFQLRPLPRTRDEVQYITGLFPTDRTQIYLGKNSTEGAVKHAPLRRYRRLHFATHSLIDETSPSRSAVVLTLDTDPDEDGFLEVSEISELDLDCDLVVLSACQTGRGQLLSGEGIVGLSRAFIYAGAREVVVSLWNVSDISAGKLMKNFYQHLKAGLGNAAALRETKLQMLKSGKETRSPYFWAPFVIIGKP